jgi:hypothetical protein
MSKELEYKIKIKKYFDITKEREITNYYVKRKGLFSWKYETYSSDDKNGFDTWIGLFFGTLLLDFVVSLLLLIATEKIIQHNELVFSVYTFYIIGFLRVVWYLASNSIMKKDFESESNAMNFIKNIIRKSELKNYNNTEEIKISYKEGKLEIEK